MTTQKSTELAVVLVSGGMDSLVCAAIANSLHQQLAFLHLNYGQRTEKKELASFHAIADHYQVPSHLRKIIDVSFLKSIGGSSLTDDKIAVKKYKGDSEEIPDSYVPAVHEDSSGYPDCRPSYYKAMNALIKEGTKNGDIEVITPVIAMKKSQIIQKAIELKAPLENSWSCYEENEVACGECDSCALRLRAFEELNVADPIPYKVRPRYTSRT